jgi:hypothetical protein
MPVGKGRDEALLPVLVWMAVRGHAARTTLNAAVIRFAARRFRACDLARSTSVPTLEFTGWMQNSAATDRSAGACVLS